MRDQLSIECVVDTGLLAAIQQPGVIHGHKQKLQSVRKFGHYARQSASSNL